jgi:hypothetical protein
MFKYTPKKQILRDMQVARVGRWWDKKYHKINEILQQYGVTPDYILHSVFERQFKKVCFHSAKRVRHVPVGGYLFPVEMFQEEIE